MMTKITSKTQRPNNLVKLIEAKTFYSAANVTSLPYYLSTGDEDFGYSYYIFNARLNTDRLVDLIKKRNGMLAVLDIGPGMGCTIHRYHIENKQLKCTGISLHNYGKGGGCQKIYNDCEIKIGNADNIHEYYPNEFFDLIFSRYAFVHFDDPWGTLCKVYDLLKPGGIFICDQLPLIGCQEYTISLINYLRDQGYCVFATIGNNGAIKNFYIENFYIRKNEKSTLELPIAYGNMVNVGREYSVEIKYAQTYVAIKELIDKPISYLSYNEKYYELAKGLILKELEKQQQLLSLVKKFDNLEQFLKNPENVGYSKLSPNNLFLVIAAIIFQSISYKDFTSMQADCELFTFAGQKDLTLEDYKTLKKNRTFEDYKIPLIFDVIEDVVDFAKTSEANSFFKQEDLSLTSESTEKGFLISNLSNDSIASLIRYAKKKIEGKADLIKLDTKAKEADGKRPSPLLAADQSSVFSSASTSALFSVGRSQEVTTSTPLIKKEEERGSCCYNCLVQ